MKLIIDISAQSTKEEFRILQEIIIPRIEKDAPYFKKEYYDCCTDGEYLVKLDT
jgi:hypothetical protein